MKNSHLFFTALLCMVLCYFLAGCAGGGTSGSGIIVVRGLVKQASGDPLTNATVELLETGTTAITDTEGLFSLTSDQQIPEITLNIKTEEIDVTVPVDPIPPETTTVTVNVVVDTDDNTGEATVINTSDIQLFELEANFTASCSAYFTNNGQDIIQKNTLRDGTVCTLKAIVRGDGILRSGVLVGLERKGCGEDAPWSLVASTETLPTPHNGIAQMTFRYHDNPRFCEYRISAPFRDDLHRQQYMHIYTLTQQLAQ